MSNISKKLVKNSIFNMVYQGLNIIFPLITSMYVARVLNPFYIGKVSFAINIVVYFVTFASLGNYNYGIRECAKVSKDDLKLKEVTSEIFFINFISTIIFTIFYLLTINVVKDFKLNIILYLIVGLQLIFNIFNVDYFFAGIEDFKFIMYRNLLVKIFSFMALLLFVKNISDYLLYAFITSVAVSVNHFINFCKARKYITLKVNIRNCMSRFKIILVFFATVISSQIYAQVDTTMLGFIKGNEAVGYYYYPSRIVVLATNMIIAITTAITPEIVNLYNENKYNEFFDLIKKVLKIVLFLTIPCSLILIIFSKYVILLLCGDKYIESINTLIILAPQVLILSIENFFGAKLLVAIDEERITLLTTIIGSILNIILNLCFIQKYSQNGVAFASTITQGLIMFLEIFIFIKIKNKKYLKY